MEAAARTILHVDMDAFYAAIEQRDNPDLRGRPVVVGGGTRGVVAAASYEVRAFGVRSAMPMAEAERRCPDLVRVAPRMAHYKSVSRQIFEVFRTYTPLVEGLSLDEAFLDVTGSRALLGDGRSVALAIKRDIRAETGLTASVGVAGNKLVAKIASDLDKPDGLVVVGSDDVRALLDPLPVEVIPGVGRRTLARLQAVGIRSVADLRSAPDRDLKPVFGRYTQRMRDKAAGIDARPVSPERVEKSISSEETFDTDLADRDELEAHLLALSETTTRRLRRATMVAGQVQVKIRRSDFTTFTRQQALNPPSAGTDQVFATARRLLGRWREENPDARIRLLGVGVARLAPAAQGELFAAPGSEGDAVDTAVDRIRDKYGRTAVGRARNLLRR